MKPSNIIILIFVAHSLKIYSQSLHPFKSILHSIDVYNTACESIFPNRDDFNKIMIEDRATDTQIQRFESSHQVQFPSELKLFYSQLGSMKNKINQDSYCFEIFSLDELEKGFEVKPVQLALKSMGLLDMILYSWGNNREELLGQQVLDSDQKNTLNHQYTCIGWYRDDTVLESAYYIFFDLQDGKFGTLLFDQDDIESFKNDAISIIHHKAAFTSLENILTAAVRQTMNTMIEWNK